MLAETPKHVLRWRGAEHAMMHLFHWLRLACDKMVTKKEESRIIGFAYLVFSCDTSIYLQLEREGLGYLPKNSKFSNMLLRCEEPKAPKDRHNKDAFEYLEKNGIELPTQQSELDEVAQSLLNAITEKLRR